MQERDWQVCPDAPEATLAAGAAYGIPPLVAQLLFNRGIVEPSAMAAFANPEHAVGADPFLLRDIGPAVARLRKALAAGETIAVYGDYDADGLTATALLVQALTMLGGHVVPFIPHRVAQGYGLHASALHDLAEAGASLVVTADCGIGGAAEVRRGRELGLEFVITDHHDAYPPLPEAVAVVNPKREDSHYPYRDLAGVGVAYKVVQALVMETAPARLGEIEEAVLDLVGIGTVADVVPLLGENRSLVRRGLARLNDTERPGLLALIGAAGLPFGALDESHISYGLAPRLNAAGRIADALTAYRLLVTPSLEEAQALAKNLEAHNGQRQRWTESGTERARESAARQVAASQCLVVADETFAVGVVGLIAAKLCEEFSRPAVVLAQDGDCWRGSARSVPGFDIGGALAACEPLLVRYGGHPLAAGLTVAAGNLAELRGRLADLARAALGSEPPRAVLAIDAEVRLAEIDWSLHDALSVLPPYGLGNPEPVFLGRGLRVREHRTVGRSQNHLRLVLEDEGTRVTAVGFGLGPLAASLPSRADVAYGLSVNEWKGSRKLELRVKGIRPAQDG